MSIWFVFRSQYDGPLSKHIQRFDGADTLLDWFRSIWRPIPDLDTACQLGEELLGTYVYSFGSFFIRIAENSLPVPDSMKQVHECLESALYGGEYRGTDDTIQVLTDDGSSSLALYWFTDSFAQAHPERVAFLLRDDWRLPETVGKGGFKQKPGVRLVVPATRSKKALYIAEQTWETSCDLEDLSGGEKIPGLRLPDLVPWLLRRSVEETEGLGNSTILASLREELENLIITGDGLEGSFRRTLAEDPDDTVTWNAYTDWLADQELPRAELHLLELALRARSIAAVKLQVAPHCVAQAEPREEGSKEFEQLFLFDDLWASGNVDLANAILDYVGRFNVLDAWDVRNEYGPDVPPGEELPPGE
jgi:uncharacterized protein (TIGR02996 family)